MTAHRSIIHGSGGLILDWTFTNISALNGLVTITTPQLSSSGLLVDSAASAGTVALSALPGWDESAFSIVVEFSQAVDSIVFDNIVQVDDGDNNDRVAISVDGTNNEIQCNVDAVGVNTFNTNPAVGGYTTGVAKVGVAVTTNHAQIAVNGTVNAADTSITMPTGLTTLRLGVNVGTLFLDGHLRRLRIFNRVLSGAELGA